MKTGRVCALVGLLVLSLLKDLPWREMCIIIKVGKWTQPVRPSFIPAQSFLLAFCFTESSVTSDLTHRNQKVKLSSLFLCNLKEHNPGGQLER